MTVLAIFFSGMGILTIMFHTHPLQQHMITLKENFNVFATDLPITLNACSIKIYCLYIATT
jgi:hypothetical protein